jgi:hypothetical protein
MNTSRKLAATSAIPTALLTGLWGWPAAIAFALGMLWLVLIAFASEGA